MVHQRQQRSEERHIRQLASAGPVPLLELRGVVKEFPVGGRWGIGSKARRSLAAVDGVSFAIERGETFSLVGESGCGKTTTARIVLELDEPTAGQVLFEGSDVHRAGGAAHRRYRSSVQAVFQDPTSALNPRRRVGDTVGEPLLVTEKIRGRDLEHRVAELLEAVGLEPGLVDSFPHELSGGMRQRVAVAQALALRPALIVLDEPVSALDVSIRAQIMNLLKDIQADYGVAYLLISHDLATVRYLSSQVGTMYLGKLVEVGPAERFFDHPMHPYSVALVAAATPVRPGRNSRTIVLSGGVPSALDPPSGCSFHPRCWLTKALGHPPECATSEPPLLAIGDGRSVACHFGSMLVPGGERDALIAEASSSSDLRASDDEGRRVTVSGPQAQLALSTAGIAVGSSPAPARDVLGGPSTTEGSL